MARGKGNATAEQLMQRASAMLHVRHWNLSELPFQLRQAPQVYFNVESYLTAGAWGKTHNADIEMTYQRCSQVRLQIV